MLRFEQRSFSILLRHSLALGITPIIMFLQSHFSTNLLLSKILTTAGSHTRCLRTLAAAEHLLSLLQRNYDGTFSTVSNIMLSAAARFLFRISYTTLYLWLLLCIRYIYTRLPARHQRALKMYTNLPSMVATKFVKSAAS